MRLVILAGLIISVNLMGGVRLPELYQGNYYEVKPVSGIGKDSCINANDGDDGPFKFDATNMSFSTWISCDAKKLISSKKDEITISYRCSAEDFEPWTDTYKFDKNGISKKGKLLYKRCK